MFAHWLHRNCHFDYSNSSVAIERQFVNMMTFPFQRTKAEIVTCNLEYNAPHFQIKYTMAPEQLIITLKYWQTGVNICFTKSVFIDKTYARLANQLPGAHIFVKRFWLSNCIYQQMSRCLTSARGYITFWISFSLLWHHNGRDGVSNHQPHDCLLNRSFRCRSKKTSKLRVTGLCVGNSQGTGEFPAQMASNAEIFPFDDVIMDTILVIELYQQMSRCLTGARGYITFWICFSYQISI